MVLSGRAIVERGAVAWNVAKIVKKRCQPGKRAWRQLAQDQDCQRRHSQASKVPGVAASRFLLRDMNRYAGIT